MDTLVVIVMLVFFVFLMVFIFSTALLTPFIGKKNILFVLSIGFIVGLVGGGFLIAPIYDDIPDIARSVYTLSDGAGSEQINVNISTDNNVTNFISNTKKLNGVTSVQSNGIILTTAPFGSDWSNSVPSRIPESDPNIVSAQALNNHTLLINANGSDPSVTVNNLDNWLMLVNGLSVESSSVNVSIVVEPSQVDSVLSKLPMDELVITSITGPVEDKIANLKKSLPDRNTVILICGFIGLFTGLIGLFLDSIYQYWDGMIIWLRNRRK